MNGKLADTPVDRRSVRTRNALSEALMALLAERGWDDIAVADLCHRADVGRSTFYSHYPNKDALLQGGLNGLQAELQRQARARTDSARSSEDRTEGFGFAPGLIEHAMEQRAVFRGLIGRRSGYAVQQRFREMVVRLVSHELPASTGSFPRQVVARCMAAAFVELLSWWVEQRTPMPPTELAALFNELSRPALDQRTLRR
jgi:AcrR family transcriptional regulator